MVGSKLWRNQHLQMGKETALRKDREKRRKDWTDDGSGGDRGCGRVEWPPG